MTVEDNQSSCFPGLSWNRSLSKIRFSMDLSHILRRTERLRQQRDLLVQLLALPDLGELHLDVTQALEELDDLLRELDAALAT